MPQNKQPQAFRVVRLLRGRLRVTPQFGPELSASQFRRRREEALGADLRGRRHLRLRDRRRLRRDRDYATVRLQGRAGDCGLSVRCVSVMAEAEAGGA
jgi:hypothetical protein